MTKYEIHIALGKALASQGMGLNFSKRLERRISALKKLLTKSY